MYKIKLFRNMSGLVAGQSLKQMVTNRDWWKGVFGNMFSTMLGIALTVGVAALVEHHNDKKLSREMMFNIVKVCEDNGKVAHEYDSIFHAHAKAADKITEIYYRTDKFTKIDQANVDTLLICLNKIKNFDFSFGSHANVDKYFYSAQMMHQFGNPNVYATFAKFVEADHDTFAKIDKLVNVWTDLMGDLTNLTADPNNNGLKVMAEVIEQHKYTNYSFQVQVSMLSAFTHLYKDIFPLLLKEMDATEEDYEDYKESIKTGHETTLNYKMDK